LKITSCRWRPPPRMHSFTATTRFKSSRSFVSPRVLHALQNATLSHSAGHASYNGSLSVNEFFFLDFFNFCWVFQKFPFFCVILYMSHSFSDSLQARLVWNSILIVLASCQQNCMTYTIAVFTVKNSR